MFWLVCTVQEDKTYMLREVIEVSDGKGVAAHWVDSFDLAKRFETLDQAREYAKPINEHVVMTVSQFHEEPKHGQVYEGGCQHVHCDVIGGMHFDRDGGPWDDIRLQCSDCGLKQEDWKIVGEPAKEDQIPT